MNSQIIQLLVLAGIVVFLILRLRNVLGTREGFEKPPLPENPAERAAPELTVVDSGPDHDIVDHVPEGSPAAQALAQMKQAEPAFGVSDFLSGARGAYEMILMSFEKGDLEPIRNFLAPDVYESFETVVKAREEQGVTVDATFVGISSLELLNAEFNPDTREGEITVRFAGELTSVVKNAVGEIIEGDPNTIHTQRDIWTFARMMGENDPNWQLVATEE